MARNDYAYQLSKDNSYNIDDLITTWESGWEHLEGYAKLQFSYESKSYFDKSKHYLDRLVLLIDDVLCPYFDIGKHFNAPDPCPKYIELLNLAASDKDCPYTPVIETILVGPTVISLFGSSKGIPQRTYRNRLGEWSKDKRKLKKAIKKLTSAFIKSNSVREVFENIADRKNVAIFKKTWTKPEFHTNMILSHYRFDKKCLTEKINPKITEAMGWLEHGTKNKTDFEEALWNCLWLYMKPIIDRMSETKINIQSETPIYKHNIDMLNQYISYGCPKIQIKKMKEGYKPEIILISQEKVVNRFNPFDMLSVILLIQPAFDLSQKFQQSFPKPRLVTQCHAPSCYKSFYSYYNRQVVCAGKGNKKTKCALEWQQYRNWLEILGKKPEKEWDNIERINEFLSRNH